MWDAGGGGGRKKGKQNSAKELTLLSEPTVSSITICFTAESMTANHGGIPRVSPLGYLKTFNITIETSICFDVFPSTLVGLNLGQCHFHVPF